MLLYLIILKSISDWITAKSPFLLVIIGNLIRKCTNWYNFNKTNDQGFKLDELTNKFALQKLIYELTHTLETPNSCTNLIFTNQQNLVIESEIHRSLYPNCHYQIFAKFNRKIIYPPPQVHQIRHKKRVNIDHVRLAINEFA